MGPVPPGGWLGPIPQPRPPGELAGWWSRVGASLIDAVLVALPALVPMAVVVALVAGPPGGISVDDDELGGLVGLLLAAAVALILITAVVFVTALVYASMTMRRPGIRNGQTWGKQLLGIKVVRMSGEAFTFGSAAVREVAVKTILFGVVGSVLAWIPTILDLLWPLWDPENRALHDLLVDTHVVRAPA